MAVTQTLLSPVKIARETLMQIENNLVMGRLVHRDYKNEFHKIGDEFTIRKPVKFVANDGYDITSQIQAVYESSFTIKVDKRKNVAFKFNSNELTLDIEEFSERYATPAGIAIADKIDTDCMALYKQVANSVGTPETTPSAFSNLADAARKLTESGVPYQNRSLVLNPEAYWKMSDAFKNMYVTDISRPALKTGKVLPLAGFNIFESPNIPTHTSGTASATTDVKTTVTKDTSLVNLYTDTGSGTFTEGDIFTVATVNAVNPVGKGDLGYLKQFVATGDVADVSNGDIGLTAMAMSDDDTQGPAYQNMSAYPVDADDIILLAKTAGVASTYVVNLAFHKNAFALVTVPLEMPDSVKWKAQINHNGISIRVMKGFDIKKDEEIIRFDVLYGVKTLFAELACRVCG